jgi:hypothetical protein
MNTNNIVEQHRAIINAYKHVQEMHTRSISDAETRQKDALGSARAQAAKRRDLVTGLLEAIKISFEQAHDELEKVRLTHLLTVTGVAFNETATEPEAKLHDIANLTDDLNKRIAHSVIGLQEWQLKKARLWEFRRTLMGFIIIVLLAFGPLYYRELQGLEQHYQAGVAAFNNQQWETASREFSIVYINNQHWDYKETKKLLLESNYQLAVIAVKNREWKEAISRLERISTIDKNYKNTQSLLKNSYYALALNAVDEGDCDEASALFNKLEKLESNYQDYQAIYLSACNP